MSAQPEISIIIPVYNCERFLRGCLGSVRDQTFEDFEVLIVNNCSTDKSEEIAGEFVRLDGRFRLLQCGKGFAGSARNVGIKAARGKYLAFVDGDDKIYPAYLERLYSAAEGNSADIAVCGFTIYYLNKDKVVDAGKIPQVKTYDTYSAMCELLRDRYMRFYLWNKLWRRELFTDNGIEIPDMYYEDAAVCPRLFSRAEKVVTVSESLYEYMRYNSKMFEINMSARRINDYIKTVPMIRLELEEHGLYSGKVRSAFGTHLFHVYFSVPLLCFQKRKELEKGFFRNSINGMKRARRCACMPISELKQVDIDNDTVK